MTLEGRQELLRPFLIETARVVGSRLPLATELRTQGLGATGPPFWRRGAGPAGEKARWFSIIKRLQRVCLSLLVLAVLKAGLGWAKQGERPEAPAGETEVSSQDLKGGFGRPETITGSTRPCSRLTAIRWHGGGCLH